jgi:hypothetical protein
MLDKKDKIQYLVSSIQNPVSFLPFDFLPIAFPPRLMLW